MHRICFLYQWVLLLLFLRDFFGFFAREMDSDGEVDGMYEREEQQRSEDEVAPDSLSGEVDVDEREMDTPAAVIGSDEEEQQEEQEEQEVVVKAKPRKRLVKMSAASPVDEDEGYVEGREEEEEEEEAELEEPSLKRKGHDRQAGDARKKLKKSKGVSKGKKEITKKRKSGDGNVEKLARLAKGGGRIAEKQQGSGRKGEKEMKEMWDSVAGNGEDSEVESRFRFLFLSITCFLPLSCFSSLYLEFFQMRGPRHLHAPYYGSICLILWVLVCQPLIGHERSYVAWV